MKTKIKNTLKISNFFLTIFFLMKIPDVAAIEKNCAPGTAAVTNSEIDKLDGEANGVLKFLSSQFEDILPSKSAEGQIKKYCGNGPNAMLIVENDQKVADRTSTLVFLGRNMANVRSQVLSNYSGGTKIYIPTAYFVVPSPTDKKQSLEMQMWNSDKWEKVDFAKVVKSKESSKAKYYCLDYSANSQVQIAQSQVDCIEKGCTKDLDNNRPLSYEHNST